MRFETLIETYHDEIYHYLWRMLNSAGWRDGALNTDDLTQEVFMKAYRAYGRLRAESNYRAWLYKIATNCATSAFRRQRPTVSMGDVYPAPADGDPLPEQQVVRAGQLDGVLGRIDKLPPMQQGALVMRYLQGLEYAEIAGALDCSEDSARANVYQALKRLRLELAEEQA